MKIGILSTFKHPLAGLIAKELNSKFEIDCIILDKRGFSKKDKEIWIQRTLNRFDYIDISKQEDICILPVNNHSDKKALQIIENRKLDLLINCGTPGILSSEIVKKPTIGILNCHPGILPFYRGCTCVEWSLFNGDQVGNTCHIMTDKIDEGPIILISKINIKECKSYQDIRVKIYKDSIRTLINSIDMILKKDISEFKTIKGGKYYKVISNDKMKNIFERYKNEVL